MENGCVGMGAPQNLCLASTFLSVTHCSFQAAMKGQVANTGTGAVRRWGKLPSPVLVGPCERGVRGPCLLCPSAFSPRALGSALKGVRWLRDPPIQRGGGRRGRHWAVRSPAPGRSLSPASRAASVPPSLALPAPLLLPPTICQRARLPPAPRGTAGAKTAICSRTSDAEGLAPPTPLGDTTTVTASERECLPLHPPLICDRGRSPWHLY